MAFSSYRTLVWLHIRSFSFPPEALKTAGTDRACRPRVTTECWQVQLSPLSQPINSPVRVKRRNCRAPCPLGKTKRTAEASCSWNTWMAENGTQPTSSLQAPGPRSSDLVQMLLHSARRIVQVPVEVAAELRWTISRSVAVCSQGREPGSLFWHNPNGHNVSVTVEVSGTSQRCQLVLSNTDGSTTSNLDEQPRDLTRLCEHVYTVLSGTVIPSPTRFINPSLDHHLCTREYARKRKTICA